MAHLAPCLSNWLTSLFTGTTPVHNCASL